MDLSISEMKNWIRSEPFFSSILSSLEKSDGSDAAHDLSHLFRVAHWALILNENQFLKEDVVASALLHDLVNLPKNHPDRAKASSLSAKKAQEILQAQVPTERLENICAAIRDHSYSRGQVPNNSLGKILQDADRLEALGAIGLMRVFSTGAKMGTAYFHHEDPWANDRPLDDQKYSIDHFFTKLLLLENSFHTPKGKEEAKKRTKFLKNFLAELASEIGVEPNAIISS
jgi:uncharacterized protein